MAKILAGESSKRDFYGGDESSSTQAEFYPRAKMATPRSFATGAYAAYTPGMLESFDKLPLDSRLARAVAELGFTTPTEIQAQTLPPLLEGRDVLGLSATGSGKTLAYGLPLLQRLDPERSGVRALVVAPTRELAAQITRELRRFARHLPGLRIVTLGGGEPVRGQSETLSRGVSIVVGTPGRLLDHLRRGNLDLRELGALVLDEADRMLDMGFVDDIAVLLEHANPKRQTALFSATCPPAIERLAQSFLRNPVQVRIESPPIDLVHAYADSEDPSQKHPTLMRVLQRVGAKRTIVFCNQKATVAALAAEIKDAAELHGDLEQRERERVLARFRNGSVHVLVATDVAARGLDINGLDLVVGYDTPFEPSSYVHRAGRTGRAGAPGLVVSIASMVDRQRLRGFGIELVPFAGLERAGFQKTEGVSEGMQTLFISGGRKDKIRPGDIVGAFTGGDGGCTAEEIGQIEVHDKFTYVGIKRSAYQRLHERLGQFRIKGRRYAIKPV